jgi:DHA1 family tetracycline resistance protein-like MFS transporter
VTLLASTNSPRPRQAVASLGNYIAALLMDVVFGCVGLGLSLRATHHFKLDYTELAMLFAVGGLSASAGCLFLSRFSDRLGRKPVILAALAGVATMSFLFTTATEAWHLYVLIAVNSCLMGVFWSSLEARITDGADGRELTRRLGMFGIFFCLGLTLGDPAGGFLADWQPLAPFYAASAVTLVLFSMLAVLFRVDRMHDGHRAGPSASDDVAADDVLPGVGVRRAFRLAAWISNAITYAVAAVLLRLFPRFATLSLGEGGLGFTGGEVGLIGGAAPLAMLCGFVVLGRLHFWHYKFRWIAAAHCVSIGGLLMYVLSRDFGFFVLGSFLFGLGKGVTYIASIYYSLHAQTARAGQSGLHEGILCFGYAAGMIVTGLAASVLTSHRVPYWVCVIVLAAGIAVESGIIWRAKRRASE